MSVLSKFFASILLLTMFIQIRAQYETVYINDLTKLNLQGRVKSVSSFSYDISSTSKDSIDNAYCETLEETFKHLTDVCVQTTEFDRKGNTAKLTRLNTEHRESMHVYHYNRAGKVTTVETFMNNGQLQDDGTYDDMHASAQPKSLVKKLDISYDSENRVTREEQKPVSGSKAEFTTTYDYLEDYPNVKKTTVKNDPETGEPQTFIETEQYDEENRLIGVVRQLKDNADTETVRILYNESNRKIGEDAYENEILAGKLTLTYDAKGNPSQYATTVLDQFLSRDRETLTLKYKYDRNNNWIRREATHKMKNRPDITVITERKITYY